MLIKASQWKGCIMPFDGYSQNMMALVLIDALLDYYDLGNRKRRKGEVNVDLLMTLQILRKQKKITGDNTRTYLLKAAATPTLSFRYLYDLNLAIPSFAVLESILFRAREVILGKTVSSWTWQHRTPRPRERVCCPGRARFLRGEK